MGVPEIRETKARTRRIVSASMARLTPSRRRAGAIAVTQRLTQIPEVREARTLMAFLSLPTEIGTWPIIQWAWNHGKRVAVPRVEPPPTEDPGSLQQSEIVPVPLESADVESVAAHPAVRPGPLGILHVPDVPALPVSAIDVVLVPCVAVDRSGNRLGRGGGFYDRFLGRQDLRARTIAVGFHEQVLDEVPVGESDRQVAMMVTDTEVRVFG